MNVLPTTYRGMRIEWAPVVQHFAQIAAESGGNFAAAREASGISSGDYADLMCDAAFRRNVRRQMAVPLTIHRSVSAESSRAKVTAQLREAEASLQRAKAAADAAPAGKDREDRLDALARAQIVVSSLTSTQVWVEVEISAAHDTLRQLGDLDDSKVGIMRVDEWRKAIAKARWTIKTLAGEDSRPIRLEV